MKVYLKPLRTLLINRLYQAGKGARFIDLTLNTVSMVTVSYFCPFNVPYGLNGSCTPITHRR